MADGVLQARHLHAETDQRVDARELEHRVHHFGFRLDGGPQRRGSRSRSPWVPRDRGACRWRSTSPRSRNHGRGEASSSAVLLPLLWGGYLVKGYAWRAMLSPGSQFSASGGEASSSRPSAGPPASGRPPSSSPSLTNGCRTWCCRSTPDSTAPASLLDVSADLGGRPLRTFRSIIAPVIVPSIAAGSIFTFSSSLGDYIMPNIVGGTTQLIGNLIARTLLAVETSRSPPCSRSGRS